MKNKIILEKTQFNTELFNFLKNNKSINLNLIDKINNFYIDIELTGDIIQIPYSYILINTNKKLNGISYINFENNCSSNKLGLCKNYKYCYSLRDQKLFKNNNYKINLNVLFINFVQNNLFNGDKTIYNNLIKYLNNFQLIRFNCNNDLNNFDNIKFLIKLSKDLKNSIISGYTNRYDLIKDKKQLKQLNKPNNLIINGSNYNLDNNYYVTTNLKTYINSNYYCLGSCKNCLKCFKSKDKKIYCLLHGSINTIDPAFNTLENRKYLIEFFNNKFNNLELTEKDLKVNKGLLFSLNKFFKQNKQYKDIKFKNYLELTQYIKFFI